ncbi:MAG: YraN family protein, partial [Brevefilum sp.]
LVGESITNPALYYQNNVIGTLNLLQAMQNAGVDRFIFSSTAATFGNPEDSVTPAKIERMENAALLWLQAHPEAPEDWRMDVIAILIDRQAQVNDLQHFINAY